jgi:hypothetical protein
MMYRSVPLAAALAASALLLGSNAAHAGAWRCVDEPDWPQCQDALINDIEELVEQEWPVPFRVAMPPMPYSCTYTGGGGGGGRLLAPERGVAINATGQLSWSIELGDLSSFLIGQHSAAVQIQGPLTVKPGYPLREQQWTDVNVNYVFGESSAEVTTADGGSTGVTDLGDVRSTAAAGAFWSGNLRFDYQGVHTGVYRCTVGYPGNQITRSGRGVVQIDYPVAWTPVQVTIAQAVRERFRRAVRIAVTGVP